MARVTLDDLLNAIRDAKPSPPSAEWATRKEIAEAMKLTVHQVKRRMEKMAREGKIEKCYAPRRGQGHGLAIYFRLKKGA